MYVNKRCAWRQSRRRFVVGWFLWAVFFFGGHDFCSVLDGGEMFVKVVESGGRKNLDSVLADSFFDITNRNRL